MNIDLNPKCHVSRFYVCSTDDGRGQVSMKDVLGQKNNLVWYVRCNTEEMVKLYGQLNVNDSVDVKQFKRG